MRRARMVGLVALAAASGACAIISASDYVGPGDSPLPPEAAATTDAEATLPDSATLAEAGASPSVILAGTTAFATGLAQQTHLVYSPSANRWAFFAFDNTSTRRLSTRISTDFVTWTDGASLALPQDHTGDGRNLAIAAVVPGAFHLSLSLVSGTSHAHYQVRATVGGDVAFEPLVELGDTTYNDTPIAPDGPAVGAAAGGRIVDISGWATPDGGVGAANIIPWVSTAPDNGASWTPTFNPPLQLEVLPQACNARALATTASGALTVYEAADQEPMPHGLRFSAFDGNSWSSPADVGFQSALFDVDDWSIAAVGSAIHVVRRADSYSHRIYENGSFGPGLTMVDSLHAMGTGVVLLVDHGVLSAYTLDPDGAVLTASLGTSWSGWTEIVPRGSTRASLTGFAGGGAAALAWVEQRPEGLSVVGWRIH